MDKISSIVRGSARVGSVDIKKETAVRPGVPGFGRPQGESPQASEPRESTASRAAALQLELNEAKKTSHDHVGESLSDQFFKGRLSAPGPQEVTVPTAQAPGKIAPPVKIKGEVHASDFADHEEFMNVPLREAQDLQPSGFVPRGSFVNVHA